MPPLNKRKKAALRKPRKHGKFVQESKENAGRAMNAMDDPFEKDSDAYSTDTEALSEVDIVAENSGLSITFLMKQAQ
ncbi:hypothetical protein BGW41_008402, partial [Actinomortierella wolfii]